MRPFVVPTLARVDDPATAAPGTDDEDLGTIKVTIRRRVKIGSMPSMRRSKTSAPSGAVVNEKNKKRVLGGQSVT